MTDRGWETAGRIFEAHARHAERAGRDGEAYAMFVVLAHGGAKHDRVRTALRGLASDIAEGSAAPGRSGSMTDTASWGLAGRIFEAHARHAERAGRDGEAYAMFAVLAHGGAKHDRVRTALRGLASDIVAESLGAPAGSLAAALSEALAAAEADRGSA